MIYGLSKLIIKKILKIMMILEISVLLDLNNRNKVKMSNFLSICDNNYFCKKLYYNNRF